MASSTHGPGQRLVISRMQARQDREASEAEEKPLGSAVAGAVAATR